MTFIAKRFPVRGFSGLLISFAVLPAAHADNVKAFTAEYTLPVRDDALKPFATYTLENYNVTTTSASATILSFEMPEDLSAGKKTRVAFTEVQNDGRERILKSESGTVRCSIPWIGSRCQFEFSPAVVPTLADDIDFLYAKYGLDDAWVERLAAVYSFSTEPIGTAVVTGAKVP